MVSEKVIVALIVIAILLSIVSIVVTLSTVNTKMIPEINIQEGQTSDRESGHVGIIINPPVEVSK